MSQTRHWPVDLLQAAAELLGLHDFFAVFARVSRECREITRSAYVRSQILSRPRSRIALKQMHGFHAKAVSSCLSVLPLVIGHDSEQTYLTELRSVPVNHLDVLFTSAEEAAFLDVSPKAGRHLALACDHYFMERDAYVVRWHGSLPPWEDQRDRWGRGWPWIDNTRCSYDFMHSDVYYRPRPQLAEDADAEAQLLLRGGAVLDELRRGEEHGVEVEVEAKNLLGPEADDVPDAKAAIRVTKRVGLGTLPGLLQLLQLSNVTLTLPIALEASLLQIATVELRDHARIRVQDNVEEEGRWGLTHRHTWRLHWPPIAVSLLKRVWETAIYRLGRLCELSVVEGKEPLARAALGRALDADDRPSAVIHELPLPVPARVEWFRHHGPVVMVDGLPFPRVPILPRLVTGAAGRQIDAVQLTPLTPEQARLFLERISPP